jgi:hypothetical protein
MISIGGTQEVVLGNQDDPWTNGLGIFDMTTLNWTNAYDAAASAYERPSLVSQFYANNPRYPIEWGDPELESIFISPNGSSSSSSSSSNTTTANASGGSGGVTGGIDVKDVVGGIIGGVAALVAMIIFSLFFWRQCRYKRKEKRSQNPGEVALAVGPNVNCQEIAGTAMPNYHDVPRTAISPNYELRVYELPVKLD